MVNEDFLMKCIVGLTSISVFLMTRNIYFQVRAERKLGKLLARDKDQLYMDFKKSSKALISNIHANKKEAKEFVNSEILLIILRNEMENLDSHNKGVLKKTFDRKSFDNQLRYASHIFKESGLLELVKEASINSSQIA